jgi:hypothetical protein
VYSAGAGTVAIGVRGIDAGSIAPRPRLLRGLGVLTVTMVASGTAAAAVAGSARATRAVVASTTGSVSGKVCVG